MYTFYVWVILILNCVNLNQITLSPVHADIFKTKIIFQTSSYERKIMSWNIYNNHSTSEHLLKQVLLRTFLISSSKVNVKNTMKIFPEEIWSISYLIQASKGAQRMEGPIHHTRIKESNIIPLSFMRWNFKTKKSTNTGSKKHLSLSVFRIQRACLQL